MHVEHGPTGTPIKLWTDGVPVEDAAMKQLKNTSSLPFLAGPMAVMPDVHWGMGSTVGSVFATVGAVVPAAVGVDIGCGMVAQRTSLTASDLPDNLHGLRTLIEAAIPHGRTNDGQAGDRGAWGNTPDAYAEAFTTKGLAERLTKITDKHPAITKAAVNAPHHLGTLGTGNHFVEVCLDEDDRVWVMLHSGSRGIGNRIGSHFINLAKRDMERWFINLPDKDLAYFPQGSVGYGDYLEAMHWAQDFAFASRELMLSAALTALAEAIPKPFSCDETAINCHHNYANFERFGGKQVLVTRKGAVKAYRGDLGIIPGSMGARSYIVEGKGNLDSFCSCSHGAGRAMSRAEAKRRFTIEDHVKAMGDVEARTDADVIDETPMAYKDIDAVLAAQSDLVSVKHTLKQVVCVKG